VCVCLHKAWFLAGPSRRVGGWLLGFVVNSGPWWFTCLCRHQAKGNQLSAAVDPDWLSESETLQPIIQKEEAVTPFTAVGSVEALHGAPVQHCASYIA
jgi:hypothetical protein